MVFNDENAGSKKVTKFLRPHISNHTEERETGVESTELILKIMKPLSHINSEGGQTVF